MEKTFFGQSFSLKIHLVYLLNLSTELKKRLGGNYQGRLHTTPKGGGLLECKALALPS